jgi:hypothetical protein
MDLKQELINLACYAVGFGYSLIAGLLIWYTHGDLYEKFHKDKSTGWRSSFTGLVERGLYTGAMLAGHLEFVGVWLVLKSVSHWERFKSDSMSDERIVEATAKFNGFFICTGLSIAYGLTGGYVTKLLIGFQYVSAFVVMIALVGTHLLLNWRIKCKAKDEINKKKVATQLTLGDE